MQRLRSARVQYTYLYLLTCYGLGDTKAMLQFSLSKQMRMLQTLNNPLHPKINEGSSTARRARKQIICWGDSNANMLKPSHHANINLFVLPNEPHSRCSTAMPYTILSWYFPMLITVFVPPFSEADIKLQCKNRNRESSENIIILINIIQWLHVCYLMYAFSNTHNIFFL